MQLAQCIEIESKLLCLALASIIIIIKQDKKAKNNMTKRKAQKKATQQKSVAATVESKQASFKEMLAKTKHDTSFLKSVNASLNDSKALERRSSNRHAYKTATSFKKSKVAKESRRKLVIDMLHEARYTKHEIALRLVNVYDIADIRNNAKAISGTIHDLNCNSACNIKVDNETSVCSCLTCTK